MPELDLSEWLKGEDVAPEAQLRFADEGKNTEIPQSGDLPPKKAFEITVILPDGSKKVWTMNMTSQRAVAGAYGKDTKQWINKIVTVFTQAENVRGTVRSVIYARVPAAAPSAPQKAPLTQYQEERLRELKAPRVIMTQDTLSKCGQCISFGAPANDPSCQECKYNSDKKGVSDNFMQKS